MSSSLGLDLDRYHAGLISVISLAGPAAQTADAPPASCVLVSGTWDVQIPILAEELAKVPDPRRAAGRRVRPAPMPSPGRTPWTVSTPIPIQAKAPAPGRR
jgi:hypothetical protein